MIGNQTLVKEGRNEKFQLSPISYLSFFELTYLWYDVCKKYINDTSVLPFVLELPYFLTALFHHMFAP